MAEEKESKPIYEMTEEEYDNLGKEEIEKKKEIKKQEEENNPNRFYEMTEEQFNELEKDKLEKEKQIEREKGKNDPEDVYEMTEEQYDRYLKKETEKKKEVAQNIEQPETVLISNDQQKEIKEEKTKIPEQEAKEIKVVNKAEEAKEEKYARAERAVENLQALYKNKEDLYSQKRKRDNLLSKFKNLVGLEKNNPKIDEEYRSIYKEYEESLKEVQTLTGKTEDQVIKDYLSTKENKENLAEEVNKKLDEKVENLDQAERQLSPEKKTLLERIKSMSTGQKIVAGVIVGGVIVVGAGTGIGIVSGMGLMQALGLPSIVTYSSYAGYAAGQVLGIGGAVGVGGTTLAGLIYEDAAFEQEDKKKEAVVNSSNESKKQEEVKIVESEIDSKIDFIPAEENINTSQESTSYEIGRFISEAKNISELYDILKEKNYSDKDIKQVKDLYDNSEYQPESNRNQEIEEIKGERLREKIKELINEKIIKKVADSSGIDQIN
jgi:hypothetical protein